MDHGEKACRMTEPPNSEALLRDVNYLDDEDLQYIIERWPYLLLGQRLCWSLRWTRC
jgi:hypothetical protein